MDLRDYDDKDRKERIARRQSRVLPKRFEEVQEEIDLRTGVLWTSHAKAVDLVGNKVVESSVEAPEMLWFDRSVEMPEPDYIPGDLIPSELYAPEDRDYSVPALQRMEHERRQCMARDAMPGWTRCDMKVRSCGSVQTLLERSMARSIWCSGRATR